jgi:hypothetical protein
MGRMIPMVGVRSEDVGIPTSLWQQTTNYLLILEANVASGSCAKAVCQLRNHARCPLLRGTEFWRNSKEASSIHAMEETDLHPDI